MTRGEGEVSRPRAGAMRPLAIVAVVAIAAAAGAYGLWLRFARGPVDDEAARAAARERAMVNRPNVVLVTLDTLRADRLGCYGYKDVETPRIDALCDSGVVFEDVSATVPLTLPSHSTIMTGRIPPTHGVRDNGGFFLDEKETTLAERFRDSGYDTGAFVAAWVLASKWGIAQGFDTYSEKFDLSKYKSLSLGSVQKRGDEVMGDALAWLGRDRARPFFAWIHLYDPHTPYDPPEPFASRYAGRPYVGEVAYTDSIVGQLTAFLAEKGLDKNTVVVLTADHGESVGDHEEQTHAFFVYESSMRVPLVIRTPWGDRGRVASNVSSADIAPTLLDLAGLEPFQEIDGRSRVRAVLAPRSPVEVRASYLETYFPRYHFGWQHLRAIRLGEWKFIDAPEPELYRIANGDFSERTNEFKANSLRAEELRKELERLAGDGKDAAPERANLDPETLERLAALGYVGSTAPVAPDAVLADPKSKIALFNRMSLAKSLAQKDETFLRGVETMRAVLAEDPGIIDARLTLANWLNKAKRVDEAIAEYREILKRQPENVIAMNNLAQVYRTRREWTAAIEGYRAVLKLDPKSPQAWYQLATLFLDTGRIGDAEKTFREALKHNPKMGASYVSLGVIAFSRGERKQAEALVRQGLSIESDLRSAHYTLARIIEERGDREAAFEARALYEKELEGFPDHGRARFNLAQLHRALGDRAAFLRELEAVVRESPEFGPGYFFLARERLNEGRLDDAFSLATRGLEIDTGSEVAPLGHFVLADVWNRRGDDLKSLAEARKGEALAAKVRASPRRML